MLFVGFTERNISETPAHQPSQTRDMAKLDTDAISLQRRGSGPPLVLLHCLGVDHISGISPMTSRGTSR